jgi:hypothetical protein
MSDGREEREEQEKRREWEQQEMKRRERAREYVPPLDREGDWAPERRDS